MSYQTIVSEITRLSLDERLQLLETLTRSVRDELAKSAPPKTGSSLARMLGILKPDSLAPTDEQVKSDYIDYLVEKYK